MNKFRLKFVGMMMVILLPLQLLGSSMPAIITYMLSNSIINVEPDVGQWKLNGMHLWMTGCNPSPSSNSVTVVSVVFTNGEMSMGTSGRYLFTYRYYEDISFQLQLKPDYGGAITMDAYALSPEYYQDSISELHEIISFWATEAEAKKYQDKVLTGEWSCTQ